MSNNAQFGKAGFLNQFTAQIGPTIASTYTEQRLFTKTHSYTLLCKTNPGI